MNSNICIKFVENLNLPKLSLRSNIAEILKTNDNHHNHITQ